MRFPNHALGFARFIAAYRRFLKDRLSLEEARTHVREGMANREDRFLELVRTCVFQNSTSPYLPLMELAGCQFGDLVQLVRTEGLREALHTLQRAGVFFTFEEFKGRQAVVRGSAEMEVDPRAFTNPTLQTFYQAESGGSTGRPTQVFIDLGHISAFAPVTLLSRSLHRLADRPVGMWLGVLPDPTGSFNLLRQAKWGNPPVKWFTPPISRSSSWRHRAFTRSLVSFGRLFGAPMPSPEILPLGGEKVAARWLVDEIVAAGGGSFFCHPSKAVRIALAAQEAGWSLEGVTFVIGGEPVTPGKIKSIQRTGASCLPLYAFSEHGPVGEACPWTQHEDEVHIFEDTVGVIQVEREVPGLGQSVGSFHFTSILPTTPKILLNVEADDFGVLEERECGCELGASGFRTLVRRIRSFSKLTAEGTTLVGNDLERILEEDLPARFGGGSLDYQLVEEEDEAGLTRLSLFIHPRVAIEDEEKVAAHLLEAAGTGAGILLQANAIRIQRREPVLTTRGKFLPLQLLGSGPRDPA